MASVRDSHRCQTVFLASYRDRNDCDVWFNALLPSQLVFAADRREPFAGGKCRMGAVKLPYARDSGDMFSNVCG